MTDGAATGWEERLVLEMHRRHLSMRGVYLAAAERHLPCHYDRMRDILAGRQGLTAWFVAAVSIVLELPPAEIGFPRIPRTELGFLAYEGARAQAAA